MSETAEKHRVAIFNSRPDFIEALRVALEEGGFMTNSAHLADIQDGTLDLVAFVAHHKPALIVYDLPRPYERHWNFLRLLKETSSLKAATWVLYSGVGFILVTHPSREWPLWVFWIGLGMAVGAALLYVGSAWRAIRGGRRLEVTET